MATVQVSILANEDKGFRLCVTLREHTKNLSKHNLTRIPSDLPEDTEYLDISENDISKIDEGDLSGLTYLCFLKMTHCNLQFISSNAFVHNEKIKVLNISHNDLSTIPDLALPQLRILDLSSNHYDSYKVPSLFGNLSQLSYLALGSPRAIYVNVNDFAPLRNTSLQQFSLGDGTELQKYDHGSLTQLNSLREITLKVTFCQKIDLFKSMLKDLDQTQTKKLILVKLFPDQCNISDDPFDMFENFKVLSNLSIVDTWMNSSVMVKLVKNIWESSFEELAFVNITYNEDTPQGSQLYVQNNTRNLRAVIFDRVHHYQYQYPKINISLNLASQMTYFKFSGTGMNILPCNLISVMPSLEILDLSDNLLDDTGFWWFACSYTSVFPALKHLSLSHNRFVNLAFISKKTHEMKVLESLDLSFNSIRLGELCSWPSHLTELSLSYNNLGNNVFQYLSIHFQKIDLTKCSISIITKDILLQFPRLTHLFLSFNSIQVLPADLYAPTLCTLYIDHNAITSIDNSFFNGLSNLQTLKAGNNPFSCGCENFWFVTNLNKSLLCDWPLDYSCSSPPSYAGISLDMYKPGWLSCHPWFKVPIALPITFVITVVLGFVFYACDGVWYTKMLWVWIRVKRRSLQGAERLLNSSFQYHAFISYSEHDSVWVESQLVPTLESSDLNLCIHKRDFVPGQWIVDNIINCVEASYKTLFVLSKNFVQSEWCNFELFFAQHRAISVNDDSLVFILLEPIPSESLPKKYLKLRTLLRQQTYLEWPKNEQKQKVFWDTLKAMLKAADKSIKLKEVATDIVETYPLLAESQ
ncbi:toll-like receptor 6 [Chanos chanos]|uniref:Toll-like receptor 6 n=1 Tax=Chanos chanos TaxID=29144 RepID=A0A6J2UY41_CHACN|nr:toll-like receptor 6 [Chanos chanos]